MHIQNRFPKTAFLAGLLTFIALSAQAVAQNRDVSDTTFRIIMPVASALDLVDFGRTQVGDVKDSVVAGYVKNTGPVPIRIDSISVAPPFALVSGVQSFVIPVGGERKVEFLFKPTATGEFTSPVIVRTQLSKALTKTIRGEGVMPMISLAHAFVDFGRMKVLTTKDTSIAALVRNAGSGTLTISGIEMLGPDKEQFSITSGGGAFSLGKGEARTMTLRFKPTSPGRTSGRIGIYYNGPGSPAVVDLFGEAEAEPISASIEAVEVKDGNPAAVTQVSVDEYLSTQYRPMLNYVFFGENKSVLEDRYVAIAPEETSAFNTNSLHQKGTLDVHHQILNIVGKRLQDNPNAKIKITGCNADAGQEKDNLALSRARAKTVAEYLKTVWRIAENRITLDARNLSATPSNSDDADGAAENRRVELSSETWEIFEPFATRDYERQMHPASIRFHNTVNKGASISTWSLQLSQNGKPLKQFEGSGVVPEFIDWQAADDPEFIPQASGTLDYSLTMSDRMNQRVEAKGQLRVEHKKVDKEVGRYSLILFDYNKATLNSYNKRISDTIRTAIPAGADISVTGYSDRIGGDEHNRKLSEDRAKNAAASLGLKNAKVKGVGKSVVLYDNDLPEGRFYSRTVNILVEKKGGGK